ncbi:hypothetical protein HK097_003154, partial [Rhizophlyctis rosea]
MAATAELSKLSYEILHCSSFDEDFPPKNLLATGPNLREWKTARFCPHPQVLIVRFTAGACQIRKIQLLSHHYKIATRIDLEIGRNVLVTGNGDSGKAVTPQKDGAGIEFTRLGYVMLDDNVKTGYKARELKTIHIDIEGEYVKFIFDKCHVNPLNLYNQVGVQAITFVGRPWNADYLIRAFGHVPQQLDPTWNNKDASAAFVLGLVNQRDLDGRKSVLQSDLSYELDHDQYIARISSNTLREKDRAVAEENFRLAKQLKKFMQICEKAAEEAHRLSTNKRLAVEAEDYDLAEALKIDLGEIKQALEARLRTIGFRLGPQAELVRAETPPPEPPQVVIAPHRPPVQELPPRTANIPEPIMRQLPPSVDRPVEASPATVSSPTPSLVPTVEKEPEPERLPTPRAITPPPAPPTRTGSPPIKGMSAEKMAELGIAPSQLGTSRPTPAPKRKLLVKPVVKKPPVPASKDRKPPNRTDASQPRPPVGAEPLSELDDVQKAEYSLPIDVFGHVL